MSKRDMSAAAVTTRLKRVSQLRRLGLSLQKAKIKPERDRAIVTNCGNKPSSKSVKSKKE